MINGMDMGESSSKTEVTIKASSKMILNVAGAIPKGRISEGAGS